MATKSTYPYYSIDQKLDKLKNDWLHNLESERGINYTKEHVEEAFLAGMLLTAQTIRLELGKEDEQK